MAGVFGNGRKKAICFDLNGTLIDPRAGFLTAVEQCLTEFTARWDGDGWQPREAALAYERAWRTCGHGARRGGQGTPPHSRSLEQRQLSCLATALVGSPLETSEPFVRRLLGHIRQAAPAHSRAYPDVRGALDRLADAYAIAVISNSSRGTVEQAIAAAGLSEWFAHEHLFTPDSRTPKKPNRAMFHNAVQRLGVRPNEALMVGNSWKTDIAGACRAGLDAVWINPGRSGWTKKRVGSCTVVRATRFVDLLDVL